MPIKPKQDVVEKMKGVPRRADKRMITMWLSGDVTNLLRSRRSRMNMTRTVETALRYYYEKEVL